MTLPQKKSRIIEVDGKKYRWLISKREGTIDLAIEANGYSGQLLQAFFDPHDAYQREVGGRWQRVRQAVSVTPKVVKQVIYYGLANGWKPHSPKKASVLIHTGQIDKIIGDLPALSEGELRVKDIASEQVSDLSYDLSLDPEWRKQLFVAPFEQRFPLPPDYFALSQEVRNLGLLFSVFNDGWTDNGFIVFGIESVDFPDVQMYTFNNPEII
ncbi:MULTISPECIES: hypothetical protein [unclassified Microcoleus]|uniref:hypothetical protein n=1 Tax=unclassified Microcoleus TaxID=2642155 RepID=UPI002FD6FEE4